MCSESLFSSEGDVARAHRRMVSLRQPIRMLLGVRPELRQLLLAVLAALKQLRQIPVGLSAREPFAIQCYLVLD